MIPELALAATILTPTPQLNASALVSRMLAKYAGAESMTGTIVMEQTLVGAERLGAAVPTDTIRYQTAFAYIRPSNKFYVTQRALRDGKTFFSRCDGQVLAYSPPAAGSLPRNETLYESVKKEDKSTLSFAELFAATVKSYNHQVPPLEIAFGNVEHLRFLREQWQTLAMLGEGSRDGEPIYRVGGLWRPYGQARAEGQYSIQLDADANLVSYTMQQNLQANGQVFELQTIWVTDFNVGAKASPESFKVVIGGR